MLPGQFVGGHALDLLGRKRRRHLLDDAYKAFGQFPQLFK